MTTHTDAPASAAPSARPRPASEVPPAHPLRPPTAGNGAPDNLPPAVQPPPHPALPPAPRTRPLLVFLALLAIAAIFGGLLLAGLLPRDREAARLDAAANRAKTDPPIVRVTPVLASAKLVTLQLPGTAQPFEQTTIHSRVNGYVRSWLVDIGQHVVKGQLLATIETPDIDAQLRQARANMTLALANLALDQNLLRRNQYMRSRGAASPVDVIDQRLKVNADQAAAKVAHATLRNLLVQKSYARITAPYAGTITQRNVDIGTLVTSGSSSSVSSLFTLQDTHIMRIFVYVPQADAALAVPGAHAQVLVRNLPGKPLEGTITRTAGALDPATRTLLVEVDVPNPKAKLVAGMYVQILLHLSQAHPVLRVPDNTLRIITHGPQVVTVNNKGVARVQPVVLGEDNGVTVQVLSGLRANQRVVVSPSDFLHTGQRVRVVAPHGRSRP